MNKKEYNEVQNKDLRNEIAKNYEKRSSQSKNVAKTYIAENLSSGQQKSENIVAAGNPIQYDEETVALWRNDPDRKASEVIQV